MLVLRCSANAVNRGDKALLSMFHVEHKHQSWSSWLSQRVFHVKHARSRNKTNLFHVEHRQMQSLVRDLYETGHTALITPCST